jgi:hypothetical protein
MSRRAYTVFTTAPDMTQPPVIGLAGEGGRKDTSIGQADLFGAWRGTTLLAFGFSYRAGTKAVAIQLRNFLNGFKGRGGAFLLPSWLRDFRLAAAGTTGDTTLTIQEAGLADLDTDRPDTEGRVIFVLTPAGSLQILGILSAVDGGGGTEVLTLDEPLAADLDIDRTMVGFVYLVRLAEDEVDLRYDVPGQCSLDLRFISLRSRRMVDSSDDVASSNIGNLKGNQTLLATDDDPYLSIFVAPECFGPEVHSTPQGNNFFQDWQATFDGSNNVELDNPSSPLGSPIVSPLYDSGFESNHLSLAFDSTSLEVLAWALDSETFRLAWFVGGVETRLTLPGISPVLFQTYTIDGTVTSGDAELVCFYIKEGFSNIFARLFRDDFAIEYVWTRSTTGPLYLQRVVKDSTRMEVQGMDTGHRRCRWQSFEYQTPVPPDFLAATIELEPGLYFETIMAAPPTAEAMGATIELEPGLYQDIVVRFPLVEEPGVGATIALEPGLYQDIITKADPTETAMGASIALEPAAYMLTGKTTGLQAESMGAEIQLETGIYEEP